MLNINLIARIILDFGSFKIGLGNPFFWIGIIIISLILLFRWGVRKFLSFSILFSALLFSIYKIDQFIVAFFGKEEGELYTVLAKPFFLCLFAFLVFNYSFLNKD